MNRGMPCNLFTGNTSRRRTSWENSRIGMACPPEILERSASPRRKATGSSSSWLRRDDRLAGQRSAPLTEVRLEKAKELTL